MEVGVNNTCTEKHNIRNYKQSKAGSMFLGRDIGKKQNGDRDRYIWKISDNMAIGKEN